MSHLLVRQKVADFRHWKRAYDAHRPARESATLHEIALFHDQEEPDNIHVLFKVGDSEKVRAFIASEDLRETMRTAGVIDTPSIHFLTAASAAKLPSN